MMFRTLYARLAATLVGLFALIGLLHVLISSSVIERYLQELTQHFNHDLAKQLLMNDELVVNGQLDPRTLKSIFNVYMDINPSIEIYLLDTAGMILSYSADPGKVVRDRVDLTPVSRFLKGDTLPILGDDPRSWEREKTFSVATVEESGSLQGYLYVVLRGDRFDSAQQMLKESYLWRFSAWAVVGSLGFGLLTGLILFYHLTRRLRRLSSAMGDFAGSGFQHYTPYNNDDTAPRDEIAELEAMYNDMARRIVSQIEQLKNQDKLRRELVAQISHDLRTPLAAVHGYLETLQIKQEVSPQERQEFIDSALRQSSRVKRMVEELFELAHLEASETRVNCEPFPLPELLQDVVQKFNLMARERGVTLEMVPPSSIPFVYADIALTERVLDNLIANAIDHTPAAGVVRLAVTRAASNNVAVQIEDSGEGIDPAEIKRIFEPFYRSRSNQKSPQGHAGLGLAIARKIVELQQGEIFASNRPEGGAAFRFTLPVAENGIET